MGAEIALLIAVIMLLGNAFFVGAEFGLVSARRSSMELKALNGSKPAKITLHAMEHVSLMLAGAQLGITLCSLILGAVAEPLFAHMLESVFAWLGVSESLLHVSSFVLALAIMVYLHVVIGEMVPKNLALANPDKTALALIPPLVFIVRIIEPIVKALNAIANGCLRLVGIKPRREIASAFSRDEVAGFVKESHHEGLIDTEEEQLLTSALELDERNVEKILIPLSNIVILDSESRLQDVEDAVRSTGYSRFPVKDLAGSIIGYVHIKDLLGKSDSDLERHIPKSIIRPIATIKQHDSLRRALAHMQRSEAHLAQVIDKSGVLLGMIALEDALEELVGEIHDSTRRK